MAEFAGKTGSGIYFKQQLSQINGWDQFSYPMIQLYQCRWLIQFIQTADRQ
uniref:Uncharacterized protein n=1 Tax=Escherichia coli TaxID=562 RepID=A0A649Z4E7_ECOLX|nr:hypothetical protein [Escherichia coli]